ncbi:MAG: hypothetical protein HYS37_02340 [Candidatus Rokubacteria bacterium]|nr:hypothetical protein [Candidatus Rokubacteria bacterium]
MGATRAVIASAVAGLILLGPAAALAQDPSPPAEPGRDPRGRPVTLELLAPETQPLRLFPGTRYAIRVRLTYQGPMDVRTAPGEGRDAPGAIDTAAEPAGRETDPDDASRTTYTFDHVAPAEPGTYWVHVLAGRPEFCCRYPVYARVPVEVEVIAPGACATACEVPGCRCTARQDPAGRAITLELIEPTTQPIRRFPRGPYQIKARVTFEGRPMFVGTVGGPAPDAHGSMGETTQPSSEEVDPTHAGRRTYTFDHEAPGAPGTYWVHVLVGRAEGCCRYQAYARVPVQVEVVLPGAGEDRGAREGPSLDALRKRIEDLQKRERESRMKPPPLAPDPPPPVPQLVIPTPRKARPPQPCSR